MSLEISLDNKLDPFSVPYQQCSKLGCGGKLGLRIESKADGGQSTFQVCRKCGHKILTSQVNIVRGR